MNTPAQTLTVQANGRPYTVAEGTSLSAFVEGRGLALERVVVERNGQPLTQAEAKGVILAEGDRLEIVRIVAGG